MGEVTPERFTLERVSWGRQRFLWRPHRFRGSMEPVIRGHVRATQEGTVLEARLTFRPLVWGVLGFLSLAFAPKVIGDTSASWQGARIAVEPEPYLLTGVWLWAIGVFYFNAIRVRKVMYQLLHLHEPSRSGG